MLLDMQFCCEVIQFEIFGREIRVSYVYVIICVICDYGIVEWFLVDVFMFSSLCYLEVELKLY